jgi:glycosyltransferase involved in cell wall biosynthesis
MKIGVWVKEGIDLKRGGAFSYSSKFLKLIDDYNFSDDIKLSFITSDSSFQSINKEVIRINNVFTDDSTGSNPLEKFLVKVPIVSRLIKKKNKSRIQKRILKVKKVLEDNNVDVIYYLTQAGRLVPDYPFISTNWDVGHLSTYMFPEFYDPKSRNNRIYWYSRGIHEALAVLVESESGKKELIKYTNINPARVMVVPMFPGDIIYLSLTEQRQYKILETFDLVGQKFFFYPAQFWAHKNHFNLVKAFKKLNVEFPDIKLILTGSDKGGNLNYILELIQAEKIKGVSHLGFVDKEELYTLYRNAVALVMPTFLGPTNMPPLEAISLGCPVICSDLKGHREQLQDVAIYVDPLDQNSIYEGFVALLQDETRKKLIEKGEELLRTSNFTQDFAIQALEKNLETIRWYRNTWKK